MNDILAVCAAAAVVVVIATILGAVELARKAVAALTGRYAARKLSLDGSRQPAPYSKSVGP